MPSSCDNWEEQGYEAILYLMTFVEMLSGGIIAAPKQLYLKVDLNYSTSV